METTEADVGPLVEAFELFAAGADMLESPFYGELQRLMANDVRQGGPIWDVIGLRERPLEDAFPLRLLGGVHRMVLSGTLPKLAVHFPTTGGDGDPVAAFASLLEVASDPPGPVIDALTRPPQTNEVGRSASLVPGMVGVAQRTGLPLRLLELGSSAGLNLRIDRYWYEHDGSGWGDSESPVRFVDQWDDGAPSLRSTATIVERRGCDHDPMDATDAENAMTLLSYVWPGQNNRFELLRAALAVAADLPVNIDRAEATEWLADQLAAPTPGLATIVFHSAFWQYLDPVEHDQIISTFSDAGGRADRDAPLAWLRLEPAVDGYPFELRLTLWDGSTDAPHDLLLATSGSHGGRVTWLNAM